MLLKTFSKSRMVISLFKPPSTSLHKVSGRTVFCLLLAVAMTSVYSAGCAKFSSKEIRSDKELYFLGEQLFLDHKYRKASKVMEQLLEEYFESEYKARALFILSESQFLRRKYEEAEFNYKKFMEIHPAHEWAEKAAYRSALCEFSRMLNYDKDQTHTLNAIKKLRNFLRKYPKSRFKKDVENRISFARHRLVEHEIYVANYYMKTKAYGPAINRYESLLKDYSQDVLTDRILFSLGNAYEKVGEKSKALGAYKKLYTNYPNSTLAKKAKKKL